MARYSIFDFWSLSYDSRQFFRLKFPKLIPFSFHFLIQNWSFFVEISIDSFSVIGNVRLIYFFFCAFHSQNSFSIHFACLAVVRLQFVSSLHVHNSFYIIPFNKQRHFSNDSSWECERNELKNGEKWPRLFQLVYWGGEFTAVAKVCFTDSTLWPSNFYEKFYFQLRLYSLIYWKLIYLPSN